MEKTSFRLNSMVDFSYLQRLQDTFSSLTKITTIIVAPDGIPLTKYSCQYDLCALLQGDHEYLKSYKHIIDQSRKTGKAVVRAHPLSGLTLASLPIMFEDKYLGCWLIGLLRMQNLDDEALKRNAVRFQIKFKHYKQMYEELPVIHMDEFDQILSFLQTLSQTIVQLDLSQKMVRQFTDSGDASMCISDYRSGEILMVNEQFVYFADMPEKDIIGKKCWDILDVPRKTFCPDSVREKLLDAQDRPSELYRWIHYNSRHKKWLRNTTQVFDWIDGRLVHMITQLDITEEQEMREQLKRLAYYDSQFSIPNKVKLMQDIAQTRPVPEDCFLIPFDIASMHHLNDVYGRDTGDELLKTIVGWVLASDFGDAQLYRIDGDEFCVVLQHCTLAYAKETAQKINDRFAEAWSLLLGERLLSYYCGVSVSVICAANIEDDNVENLIERTLNASRKEKHVTVYDETMDIKAKQNIRLALSLKNCVKQDMIGFDVFYQPIVELASCTWKGVEALCRWTSPSMSRVSPSVFIREAEKLGLINLLGYWVLERAIKTCKELGLDQYDGFYLSVNISPIQIMDSAFAQRLLDLLKKYAFPGDKLNLEVTESMEFTFNRFSMSVIEELRGHGVKLALDDFGTGYSSFDNLKNLPISYVKTERAFLEGIEEDNYLQYFYFIMSELAHANNMKLIAEGVETYEQLEFVLKNGADYIQGFFFSKPLSTQALQEQLHHFHEVSTVMYSLNPRVVDIQQLLSGKNVYSMAPNLFKLLNRCMQLLLNEEVMEVAFQNVLDLVGKHFQVDHAYVYVVGSNDPKIWHRYPQSTFKLSEIAGALVNSLKTGDMIAASDISRITPDLSAALYANGIQSIVALPLRKDETFLGFVGFDAGVFREWHPEEIIMLWNLAMMMTNFVIKANLAREVDRTNNMLAKILESTELSVYVADLDTHEILWANQSMKHQYNDEHIVGKKCYEVLHGRTSACLCCNPLRLIEEPALDQISYEQYYQRFDRSFMVYDSLITWQDRERVFIEYSLDITNLRNAQMQVKQLMEKDLLTQTVNRATLMQCMRHMLSQANNNNTRITLVLINIDGLAYINTAYGESLGDMLIADTTDVLRANIRTDDILGRFDGNEFVVIMPGCGYNTAAIHIDSARKALEQKRPGMGLSFQFGVVENTEIPYEENDVYLNKLLQLAMQRIKTSQYPKAELG